MRQPSGRGATRDAPTRDEGRSLIIFARAPVAGQVKTRLAADLGTARALDIYRWLGVRILDRLASLQSCELRVAFTPADGELLVRDWLGDIPAYEPQVGGDLGQRMAAAAASRFTAGAARVCVIGTDCPAVDAAVVEEAFTALDAADVVFGPATDGGYYLVALARPLPELFESVPWSAPDTLAVTLDRAKRSGARVTLLAESRDIDTGEDWAEWQRRHS
ncbi:MAG: TIGR04282 family arsenosugar biosynthesis glycosyltransferase [Gemmatimonadaceae bacterium]